MLATLIDKYRLYKSKLFPDRIIENGTSLSFDSSIKVKIPSVEKIDELAFYKLTNKSLNFEVRQVIKGSKGTLIYQIYCIENNGTYLLDSNLFKLLMVLNTGGVGKTPIEKLVRGKL